MNLRFYGPRGNCVGGGEKYMDALAEALSLRHNVEIVDSPKKANVVMSNDRPYGKKLCYILQIPYGPINPLKTLLKSGQRAAIHDVNRLRMLQDARKSSLAIVYSTFVKDALKSHGIDATVLYPPVEDYSSKIKKKKVILSVGRFFEKRIYNHKRYEALIEAFKLFHKQKPGWEYRIVGGMEPSELPYVQKLQRQAEGYPISFWTNVSDGELRWHYGHATLFWHGAGYETRGPEEMESFGISIVEAMSAGCVPIVYTAGGPREFVTYLENGMTWVTPTQLAYRSRLITSAPKTLQSMSDAAKERSHSFNGRLFQERALSIFGRLK